MVSDEIREALERGADMTEEEYAQAAERADRTTQANGVSGEAPLDEETRHKRIQTNFFGSVINILMSMLSEVSEVAAINRALLEHLISEQKRGDLGGRTEEQ